MEAAYTPHQVTLASPATVEARGGKRRVAPEGETPSAKEKRIEQQAYALGVQFMIFRLRGDNGWKSCEGVTPGHIADSMHHRYQRLVGFKQVNQEAMYRCGCSCDASVSRLTNRSSGRTRPRATRVSTVPF
ncbi:hypothetical protein AB1Y20_010037 [Prymnesium parvum]|uniref:Uncharacterized protein n=1 Tax=Prymnesium parvum TaxID=97485 RepID=A0AB34K670_PRYPA|mmetsp:Transcript_11910/g.29470  ORF Transcript_11910/g.29470 Transcript_11910/m.29470 type:complete len:131 (+) Transcript_11910:15-407(+)